MFIASITGFLIKDAIVKPINETSKLVSLAVSVKSENPKNKGQKPAAREIVNVTTFMNNSSSLPDHLKSGTNVEVTGRAYIDEFEGKRYFKMEAESRLVNFGPPSAPRKSEGSEQASDATTPSGEKKKIW